MNRTTIDWVRNPPDNLQQGFTWNPEVGCSRGCSYCYAEQQAKRQKHRCSLCYAFVPHFHKERFHEPLNRKKTAGIFVCSMGEFFDKYNPFKYTNALLDVMERTPQHRYYLLTKAIGILAKYYLRENNPLLPSNIPIFPENVWLGVSVDGTTQRFGYDTLRETDAKTKFVSFEPLRGPVKPKLEGIDWIIIGPTSTRKGYIQPKRFWIETIIEEARNQGCAIFLKNKLDYPKQIQEFPE